MGSAENDSRLSDESSARGIKYTYPSSYLQALGRCIVEVLSDIFLNKYSLFNPLCTSFWKDCLEILQQREQLITFHEHVEQIVGFFVLLDELVPSKGQTWPLDCLARPLVTNSFHAIRSTVTSMFRNASAKFSWFLRLIVCSFFINIVNNVKAACLLQVSIL